jgi:hypothetical protein
MARRNKVVETLTEKKPSELAGSESSSGNHIPCNDYTTKTLVNQGETDDEDMARSQDFRADGNYKQILDSRETRGYHWLFIVYPESAPADWREQLEATGLAFAVSPLHDSDKNPDGSPKKPHYHVIVSYTKQMRYATVIGLRVITKGPFPLRCDSVNGTYAYFTHKNNPEKYQYNANDICLYNGWQRTLEAHEICAIKKELTVKCFVEDITEYAELIVASMELGGDYEQVAMSNTLYFNHMITSFRNNPIKTLYRFYNQATPEQQSEIKHRITVLEAEREV